MIKIVVALLLTSQLVFMGFVFQYNLPHWCTELDRPGNWVIEPLCH
jgi:hypothetical protein